MVDDSNRRAIKTGQAPWLVSLQNDMTAITAQAALRHWPGPIPGSDPYFNYRLEHVQQVEREALNLLNEPELQPADPEIVLAAVWIHDRFKPQYEGDDHARQAAGWARDHLAGTGFPPDKLEAVIFAVEHHADLPGTLCASSIEARLVWDADKLTKIGPLNIISKLVSHPAFPEQSITYTSMALLGLEQLEKSRRLVDAFYFEASRTLARVRFAHQKAFYELLARDVDA